MSGFILGTGSGILASAAVYYTISTNIANSTSGLRSELHNSASLLGNSFDPVPPPAHSSLVGPSSSAPYADRPFSSLLRERWNSTLSSAVEGVRRTDWTAVGVGIYEAGSGVVRRVAETTNSGASATGHSAAGTGAGTDAGSASTSAGTKKEVEGIAKDVKDVVRGVKEESKQLGKEIKEDTKDFPGDLKATIDGIDLKEGSIGTVGGNAFKEQVKRNAEEKGGRLV